MDNPAFLIYSSVNAIMGLEPLRLGKLLTSLEGRMLDFTEDEELADLGIFKVALAIDQDLEMHFEEMVKKLSFTEVEEFLSLEDETLYTNSKAMILQQIVQLRRVAQQFFEQGS